MDEERGTIGCGAVIVIIIIASILTYFFSTATDKNDINVQSSEQAIEIAETINLNEKYKDKTIKNGKEQISYVAYKFNIEKAGKLGVEYKCKKTSHSEVNIVRWEIINLKTNEVIRESEFHNTDVKMKDIKPGEYAIQFFSAGNQFGWDIFRRSYKFKLVYEP